MSFKIHLFHGFLGLPRDWSIDGTACDFAQEKKEGESMEEFAQRFALNEDLIVGYSMGGRLALHLLSERLKGAIFISTNPKGASKGRLLADEGWARRFLNDPWEEVVNDWNRQIVFEGSVSLLRKEADFNRKALAKMLVDWSLAKQKDFTKILEEINLPILWIVGEKDEKFKKMLPTLRHPKSKVWIAEGASHRVPWDQPEAFKETYHTFLENL